MVTNLNIHTRLKLARKALKLNQIDVANDLDIQQKTVSDIENGKIVNIPNSYIYYFYLKGLSLEWIFDNKGKMLKADNVTKVEEKSLELPDNKTTNDNKDVQKEDIKENIIENEHKKAENKVIEEKNDENSTKPQLYERIIDAKDDTITSLQTHIKFQESNMEFLKDFLWKVFNNKGN